MTAFWWALLGQLFAFLTGFGVGAWFMLWLWERNLPKAGSASEAGKE